MKHILITGGAGFIGSHLCDSLLERGYAVTAVDNLLTGAKRNLESALRNPDFQFIEANVSWPLDTEAMRLLQLHGLDGVLHFACPASPVDFDRIPFFILEVDSLGTMNTVNLALEYKARYVLASTSEIYGDPLVHPQTEDYYGNVNSIGPRACYDEAKRFGEAYVSTAMRHRSLNAAIVRIFNTYGPRMRPDDGRVIPEFCMQALQGGKIPVCGDGRQTRSLCYVTDLVEGIIRLYESSERTAVNLGNPDERSVLEMAELIREMGAELNGARAEIVHIPARPDDPRRRCPNIDRARQLLGWQPRIPLRQGLANTLDYFNQRIGSSRSPQFEEVPAPRRSLAV